MKNIKAIIENAPKIFAELKTKVQSFTTKKGDDSAGFFNLAFMSKMLGDLAIKPVNKIEACKILGLDEKKDHTPAEIMTV